MTHSGIFPDLIFVSLEDWDEIWRRNQFLCAGLAERFPDARLLFVGLPRDVSHNFRRGKVRDVLRPATASVPGHPNITVLRPLKFLPNTLAWGRRLNDAHARAQIRRAAARLGLRRPLLWLNPHAAVHMAGRMGERAVVYDITDDWTEANAAPREKRRIIDQDAALCRRADTVIVCSRRLYQSKQDCARDLHLIPNGVDARHYETVLDTARPVAADAAHWPHPVFGYTGTIHPERVDVALVSALAQAFPQGTVALVGPDLLSPEDRRRLHALGNVALTGPVAYQSLPDYMRAFDVCITPHCMTPFTESLNPIKLWEYLAGGKPIASTDVAGFRDYPQFVHLAADAPGFIAACRAALDEDGTGSALRQAEARKHTWDARIDCVQSVLQGLGERP